MECIIWECSLCDVCGDWQADLPWYESTSQQYDSDLNNDAETDNVSMPSYGYATLQGIIQGLRRTLVGSSVPASGDAAAFSGGAVGTLGTMIGAVYQNPPASSVEYLAYMGEKAGFTSKAYAQGVGFRGFFPLIKIWSAMRNTAYLFFAFIFIVIGLMVIFRVKIDPRTVIAVQTALPRMVISLLLVTFSYAIVGLLIDVMNVVIGLLVWLFHTADLIEVPQITIAHIHEDNVLKIMSGMFAGGAGGAIAGLVKDVIGGLTKLIPNILGGGLVELILALALVSSMFKLLFNLVMAYVGVIISVIMAPLQIAFNAIPNWNTFKAWLVNLLASLSVFPTVAAMLILAATLTGKGGSLGAKEFSGIAETGWRPPLIGGKSGSGGLNQEAIMTLIGYGLLLMTPGMVDRVKKLFQVPPAEMPAIGAAVGAGARGVAAPVRGLGRLGAGETLEKFRATGPGTWRETAAQVGLRALGLKPR